MAEFAAVMGVGWGATAIASRIFGRGNNGPQDHIDFADVHVTANDVFVTAPGYNRTHTQFNHSYIEIDDTINQYNQRTGRETYVVTEDKHHNKHKTLLRAPNLSFEEGAHIMANGRAMKFHNGTFVFDQEYQKVTIVPPPVVAPKPEPQPAAAPAQAQPEPPRPPHDEEWVKTINILLKDTGMQFANDPADNKLKSEAGKLGTLDDPQKFLNYMVGGDGILAFDRTSNKIVIPDDSKLDMDHVRILIENSAALKDAITNGKHVLAVTVPAQAQSANISPSQATQRPKLASAATPGLPSVNLADAGEYIKDWAHKAAEAVRDFSANFGDNAEALRKKVGEGLNTPRKQFSEAVGSLAGAGNGLGTPRDQVAGAAGNIADLGQNVNRGLNDPRNKIQAVEDEIAAYLKKGYAALTASTNPQVADPSALQTPPPALPQGRPSPLGTVVQK